MPTLKRRWMHHYGYWRRQPKPRRAGKSCHGRLVGVRRVVSEGLWRTSKAKSDKNRDGRVGAFALAYLPTDEDRPIESSDMPEEDEEEGRWISVVSSEQFSTPSPQGVVGCQTTPGGENDHKPSHTSPCPPTSTTSMSSNSNPRGASDKTLDEEVDVLVCGMKTNVFVGVVITFSILIIIMVAIAVRASICRQASLAWPC